ncbi:MAG: ROK family protein [Candidatus Limnocylindrales bacterium]
MDGLDRFLVQGRVSPPLDPGFRPAVLARRKLADAARLSRRSLPASIAVEQPGASVYLRETWVFSEGDPAGPASNALCERLVKTMLWARGGCRIWVDGPDDLAAALRRHYSEDAAGRFDAEMMDRIYDSPLEVVQAARAAFPRSRDGSVSLGGDLKGCRIGFDLGASDRKAAAVIDGEVVFSEETPWDPSHQSDPQWHYDQIMDSLRRAAEHLPRVDAIGGSAAGVYVDNEARSASLFRSVPPDQFHRVRNLFHDLRAAWGGVPFAVANDGDVTALAGSMVAGVGGLLGLAMGSSEAAGYVTRDRSLTHWLNELAFTPIDYAPDAPIDEWSGDRGCGARYFSQQCLPRLLPAAGIEMDDAMPLPDRLVALQELMARGDQRAARVYETIGTHLGYALLDYADFYDFEHVLLLGRVMTGHGGEVIQARAAKVLAAEGTERPVKFHEVSERDKRHGQAVAAASLPRIAPAT